MSSLDRILPFLKPIEDLLVDPSVTEVMVNDGCSMPVSRTAPEWPRCSRRVRSPVQR